MLLINLIFGGLVFTSDNIDEYNEQEMQVYKSIFPIKEKIISSVVFSAVIKINFTMDNNEYLVLSNLKNDSYDVVLKDGSYLNREKRFIYENSIITLKPYESMCLLKTETTNLKLLESTNIFML